MFLFILQILGFIFLTILTILGLGVLSVVLLYRRLEVEQDDIFKAIGGKDKEKY